MRILIDAVAMTNPDWQNQGAIMAEDTLFLCSHEALEAVIKDLRRYEPQLMLCCEILRFISGGSLVILKDSAKGGAWISRSGHRSMRWYTNRQLVDYTCSYLREAKLSLSRLTAVCSRVFQTHAIAGPDRRTGEPGVWIETGMEAFCCRQCGLCCRTLDYHDEIKASDVKRWQALGRDDILHWVGTIRYKGEIKTYQIWVDPATNRFVEGCPFLQYDSSRNTWNCGIHDVKPDICRQYPTTRKHALMTGCPGFAKTCDPKK
jgi:Fe-S-cluster containining protein